MSDYRSGLRTSAYICMKLAILAGILWLINIGIFFTQYFSNGFHLPNFREIIAGYGGALIVAIIPILMLYNVGGIVNLLLDIEANTRAKTEQAKETA